MRSSGLTEALGVTKYEPPEPGVGGPNNGNQVHVPQQIPVYGVEGYRKYGRLLEQAASGKTREWQFAVEQALLEGAPAPEPVTESIEVVVTEKLDGQNWRAAYLLDSGKSVDQVIVGTHKTFRDPGFVGEKAYHTYLFQRYNLGEGLRRHPNIAIYGEAFGAPMGGAKQLTYGVTKGANVRDTSAKCGPAYADEENVFLRLFDALDIKRMRWLDWDELVTVAADLGVPTVPVLYRGPFDADHVKSLAGGKSTLADHIREGVVISCTTEGRFPNGVRRKLKLVSEAYLMLK